MNSLGDNGERIVGQEGYAEYLADSGWWGSLNTLKPNRGYKLETSSEATMTYPSSSSGKREPTNHSNAIWAERKNFFIDTKP